ncbi:MAG: alpha-mannosidase [Oscillospiraceae bacterium]|nr:alpha-mannosidase [Oscillospiraceae bacterium]
MDKTYYMIGNAHLDPVWQWRWTEGYAETKATFRSALDRMNEYKDFVFVCAAAAIYEWIEECVPSMFEEIKHRVNEGRWIIVGGWWVQPDCNIPSGESFVRHGLYSQNYFNNKFGVTSKVGYNVDSFGHNQMLPQILKKSGMDYYVFMRPGEHEKHFSTNIFKWLAPDGSNVLAFRLNNAYCLNFKNTDEMQKMINDSDKGHDDKYDETMIFYGVGNHGGGPTIKNINSIKEMQEKYGADKFLFSNPETFFKKIIEKGYDIETLNDDLQHHASGCYAACSLIKTLNRRCETSLIAAEKYSVFANVIAGKSYPLEKFGTAWKNTLFNQFHDSLGGCSIEEVYDDAALFANEALSIAAKAENSALQTISWQIDTMTREEYPVIIFNPHSWDIETDIVINKQCAGVLDTDGNAVAAQHVHSPTESCTWRKDTLFRASIPAMGYTTYYMSGDSKAVENTLRAENLTLENKYLKITFEGHTGYIREMFDKETNSAFLDGNGAVPIVIDEFEHDTWSHARNFFTKKIARFGDAKIEYLENGPVRATVKVTSKYNGSVLTQYFMLGAEDKFLTVKAEIDWHEKHKMLKLCYPANVTAPEAIYEIPYGNIKRPCDGEEESGQQWMMVRGKDCGMALINDNKYSFSIENNTLMLTVVRSPIYGDHGGPRTSESVFTDQGAHDFRYIVMPCEADMQYNKVIKLAQVFNTPPAHIIENRHQGRLAQVYSGMKVKQGSVIVSAVKAAENSNGYVVRAYETDGTDTCAAIDLPLFNVTIETCFGAYEIKTFYIDAGSYREILMTEMGI